MLVVGGVGVGGVHVGVGAIVAVVVVTVAVVTIVVVVVGVGVVKLQASDQNGNDKPKPAASCCQKTKNVSYRVFLTNINNNKILSCLLSTIATSSSTPCLLYLPAIAFLSFSVPDQSFKQQTNV